MFKYKVLPGYVLGLYLVYRAAAESDVWMMVAAGGVFLLTQIYAAVLHLGAEAYLIRINTMLGLRDAAKEKK